MDNTAPELKTEHQEWLNQIRSWEKELSSFEEVNGEIAARAADQEARKQVEHFQNQFIVQKQRLDQMKHNIKVYGGNPERGSSEITEYAQYYQELKNEFDRFSGFHS